MPSQTETAFVCYSREDSQFVRQLVLDLKEAGAQVWLDKLDIKPGQEWAPTIEIALKNCARMLVILSPNSVNSPQVRAEFGFALSKKKEVIPVLHRECEIPYLLLPYQTADFTADYQGGVKTLLDVLEVKEPIPHADSAAVTTPLPTPQVESNHVDELRYLAEAGDDSAMVELGDAYADGELVARDSVQAFTWCSRAAEAGNVNGMLKLGRFYATGQGVLPDHFQAANWFKRAAEQGEPYAMFDLAYSYEFGQGVEQDYNQARKWYEGSRRARPQDVEGALERIEQKEAQKKREAEERMRKAAEEKQHQEELERQRQAAEQARLEKERRLAAEKAEREERERKDTEEKQRQEKLELQRQAAEQARLEEERRLATEQRLREDQERKAAEERARLATLERQSRATGFSEYVYYLVGGVLFLLFVGWMTYTNWSFSLPAGVDPSLQTTYSDARRGNTDAMLNMAEAYDGRNAPRDPGEAIKWIRNAADAGNVEAMTRMGERYENGLGVMENAQEALQWYSKAVEHNYAPAMYDLGKLYESGKLGTKDHAKAVEWLSKAAQLNFHPADFLLQQMNKTP